MKYTTILFDADGTLFDYDKAEALALETALAKYGLPMPPETHLLYRKINQSKWELFEQGAISKIDLQVSRFEGLFSELGLSGIKADKFNADYLDRLAEGAQLTEYAYEVCAELAKTKRLAIITNGVAKVQFGRIKKSLIKKFITDVFVSEDIGFSKPDARYFDYVFKTLGLRDKSLVLVVGDSLTSDIQGGANYGLDTCYFNPSNKQNSYSVSPTYEIISLTELLRL
ncbi:MAG: YjjG family noncanonical pyrimidine nucleotidase [Clostridiales bacterium]|jgi:2-haloacid dehalogenase|nr:YjjG family noncanonical pyrimidine nucleotidase [Clostridiales bacterium]